VAINNAKLSDKEKNNQLARYLGAGIPVPPLIDVGGMASGLAGNALKTVGL
jgi:hypothetical protein